MTEREQLIAWLHRCNVPYWIIDVSTSVRIGGTPFNRSMVKVSGNDDLVTGYGGFYIEFQFDDFECLTGIGAWE